MKYVVFTEIINDNGIERWYYGTYADADRANEVALMLGADHPVYHSCCKLENAEAFHIMNMPRR